MKKYVLIIAIALCMGIGLTACSQPSQQTNESSAASSSQEAPSKDEIKAYLTAANDAVTEANAAMNDALNCLTNGDASGCAAANDAMDAVLSEVQSMNVPSTCQTNYGYLKEYALNGLAATASYTAAAFKTNPSEQGDLIEDANASVSDATEALNRYNSSLREIPLPE